MLCVAHRHPFLVPSISDAAPRNISYVMSTPPIKIGLQLPAFNWDGGTEQISHKLDVLKRHCDNLGHNFDDIERTALGTVHLSSGQMSAADVIALCRSVADVGIQHVIFNMPNTHDITPLDVFGRDIIPNVAGF